MSRPPSPPAPRKDNWRSALIAYVDQQADRPFAYGVNDCLLVTAGAVEAMTGVDHAADYRGRYTSLSGGKKLVGKSPLRVVADLFPEIRPSMAGDGDIAACRQGKDWAFGVLIGAHFYVQTQAGLGILPRSAACKAFKV